MAFFGFIPFAPVEGLPIAPISDVLIQVDRESLGFFDALRGVSHLDLYVSPPRWSLNLFRHCRECGSKVQRPVLSTWNDYPNTALGFL